MAELLAAPVFGSSWPSRIPFPTAHPLWFGNYSDPFDFRLSLPMISAS
jgi:hypothetical protein